MCIAAIGPILGAALSVAGAMAEYSAAKDAAAEQNAYYEQNRLEAQRAARDTYVHQQTRINEEREAASQTMFEDSVKALEARGSAYTSAGEAGVSGLSVDALVGNIFAKEGRQHMATLTNYEMKRDEVRAEMEQTRSNAQARINSVRRASNPSAAPFLIKGLSGAVGALKGLSA